MKRASVLLLLTLLGTACASEDESPTKPEVIRFDASTTRIGPGERLLIQWSVSDAESISVGSDDGMIFVGGSSEPEGRAMVGPLLADTVFTLRAEGPGGRTGASILVQVEYPAPSITEFRAAPAQVLEGDSSVLSWQTTNGTQLVVEDDAGRSLFEGEQSAGMVTVTPLLTTVYTLSLQGPGGTATATTSVIVRGAPPVIQAFGAQPESIFEGDESLLSWNTLGAAQLQLRDGDGGLLIETSSASGTFSVRPTSTTVYVLTVTNDGGQDQAMARVSVEALELPKIVDLAAQPEIVGLGDATAVSWNMSGADSYRVLANGVEVLSQNTAGDQANEPLTITSTHTRVLVEVQNRLGTASAEVSVLGHRAPSVNVFTATPVALQSPGTTLITWDVSNVATLDIMQDGLPLSGFAPIRNPGATGNAQGSISASVADISRFTLVAVSAAGMTSSQALVAVGVSEVEINDTVAQAMAVTGTAARIRADLSAPTDIDVYQIDVPSDGEVYARTLSGNGSCNIDTRLTLTATDGVTVLVLDDNDGPGSCSLIDPAVDAPARGLGAGSYYLTVQSRTATTAGPYVLEYQIRKPLCGDNLTESSEECDDGNQINADGCDSSCILEIAATVSGPSGLVTLPHPGGASFISVAIDTSLPGQAILARANDPGAGSCDGVDTHLTLLDASFRVLGTKSDGGIVGTAGTCAAIVFPQDAFATDLDVGRYYLQVRSDNAVAGNVDVVVTVQNPTCGNGLTETRANEQCDDGNQFSGDGCSASCLLEINQTVEVEPNDNQATAFFTGLSGLGTITIEGGTNPAGDDDVFSFTVPAQTTMQLSARTFSFNGQPASCDSQTTDTRMYLEASGVEVTSPTQPGALAFNDDIDNANNIWCSQISGLRLLGGATGTTYYLRIQGWRDIATTQYFLRIELQP